MVDYEFSVGNVAARSMLIYAAVACGKHVIVRGGWGRVLSSDSVHGALLKMWERVFCATMGQIKEKVLSE